MSDISKKTYEQGYEKGYENGVLKCVLSLMTSKRLSPEKAISLLDIPDEDKPYYLELVAVSEGRGGYTSVWASACRSEQPYTEEEKEEIRKYCEQHGLDPNRVAGYNE